MKIATTPAQKIAVIDTIARITEAAGQSLTRGDVADLVHAARSTMPYTSVTQILDVHVRDIGGRARAVLAAIGATEADVLDYL